MKLDAAIAPMHLTGVPEVAKAAEQMGFDCLWTQETQHNPFLPCALIAEHTESMQMGTAIAVSFARSPGDLAYTACGRFDAFWEYKLFPWDFSAGVLLVREAGGIVTGFSGDADVYAHHSIVAGTPRSAAGIRMCYKIVQQRCYKSRQTMRRIG